MSSVTFELAMVKLPKFHMLVCSWSKSKFGKQCDIIFYIGTLRPIGWIFINSNEKSRRFTLGSQVNCISVIHFFTLSKERLVDRERKRRDRLCVS